MSLLRFLWNPWLDYGLLVLICKLQHVYVTSYISGEAFLNSGYTFCVPREREPELTPEERDVRTVFCMQLSARIRPRDLEEFFSAVGKVHLFAIIYKV